MSTASSDETEGFKEEIKKRHRLQTILEEKRITYSACKMQRIELIYQRHLIVYICGVKQAQWTLYVAGGNLVSQPF